MRKLFAWLEGKLMTDSLKQRTISSVLWRLFERFGSSLVSLVVQIVMARLLTPDDFGLLAIMLVFITLSDTIAKSGLTSALVQTHHASEEDFTTVFWITFGLAWLLYVIIFLGAPWIARFYESDTIIWPLRILALVLPINAFNSVQWARVARDLVFKKTFVSTLISVVVSGAAGVALAIGGAGLWALVGQQLIYAVVNCLVLKMQVSWLPSLVFSAQRAKELFSFGWKLLASGLVTTGFFGIQNLIIGKQFSAHDLGLVSQGEKYPNVIGRIVDGAVQSVMMSAVARVQDDEEYVRRLLRRATKTISFCLFPLMGLMALVAEPLVLLLLGEKWLPCVPFLQMYCFIYAQLAIQGSSLQAINGIGRSGLYLKLDLINKGIALVALLIAAFVFKNVYAVVIAAMICSVAASIVDSYPSQYLLGYSYSKLAKDTFPLVGITLLAMAVAFPVCFLHLQPILVVLLQGIVMVSVYLILAKLFHIEAFGYLHGAIFEMIKGRTVTRVRD